MLVILLLISYKSNKIEEYPVLNYVDAIALTSIISYMVILRGVTNEVTVEERDYINDNRVSLDRDYKINKILKNRR